MSNEVHINDEALELYAIGALPDAEAAEVQAHSRTCSSCAAKLAEWRAAAALMAFRVPQERPSVAVKERLFAQIAAEKTAAQRPDTTRATQESPRRSSEIGRRLGWWNWILVPATAVLAIVSYLQLEENTRLRTQLQTAQRQAEDFEHERVRILRMVNVLAAPETITVKLAGTEDSGRNTGLVRYNSDSGLVVYLADLPALPADRVYQMWLVPSNGAPINAGTFAANNKRQVLSAEVPANTEAKAFAVTIEPVGGSPRPTGPKVLLGAS